jgi:hypothetical protein
MWRRLALVVIIIVAVLGSTAALARYAYNSVDVEQSGDSTVTIDFNRDWPFSSRGLIEGVTFNATVEIRNATVFMLWMPSLHHELFVDDEYIGRAAPNPSMWLGPRDEKRVPVSAYVSGDALPLVVLELILSGGSIDIRVQSTGKVAGITVKNTTVVTAVVRNGGLTFEVANGYAVNALPSTPALPIHRAGLPDGA